MRFLLKACFFALVFALFGCGQSDANDGKQVNYSVSAQADNASVTQAFINKKSGTQVSGQGVVVKLLPDDNKGARHQKFLVKINAEQTLLFAHNIDLAPRVPLQTGDEIRFSGEYVYNPKGGIIHWTHHAPGGDHAAGWVELGGRKYQ